MIFPTTLLADPPTPNYPFKSGEKWAKEGDRNK